MGNSLRADLSSMPAKRFAKATLRGEGAPKNFGNAAFGAVIERCFALSGLNKEQAAFAMGYSDASTVSRWISGQENPHILRIWSVNDLRAGFLMALAEAANEQVEIATTFTVRRRSA